MELETPTTNLSLDYAVNGEPLPGFTEI